MIASLLYLLAVALTLYGPFWLFPGFEGPEDIALVFALAVASATRAAIPPGPTLPRAWSNPLALAWVVGCTLCALPAAAASQLFLRSLGLFATGVVIGVASVRVLFVRGASSTPSRGLHGLALVAMGAVLVAEGASRMLTWWEHAGALLRALVWASTAFNIAGGLASRQAAT